MYKSARDGPPAALLAGQRALVILCAAFLPLIGACHRGAGDAAPVAVVNVFNWADFIDPTVVKAFEQETGIKVNYTTYDSNEQLETILLTGHADYDVVVPGGAFLERGIQAHVYQPLDHSQLPNLKNLDPEAVRNLEVYDPGARFGVPYMWLTTVGLAVDAERVRKRLPQVPLDGWGLFYEPANLKRLTDCGVSVLDAPDDVASSALAYLGKDPNSESLQDLAAVEQLLLTLRPYITEVDSTRYVDSLANREVCLAIGWAGDVAHARERAREAGRGYELAYVIPREGSLNIMDMLAIPSGAGHRANAYAFINYLLRAEISARNANETMFASPVTAARPLLSPYLANDPTFYPPAEVRARLVPQRARSQQFARALNRVWTRFKTGT